MNSQKKNIYNITFIGAGIATSYTLLSFLEKLNTLKNTSEIIKLNIIDKYPEFFRGIPYGKRSGDSVLLINSLRSFLPEPERSIFIVWLIANKKTLIDEFLESGGDGAKLWHSNNLKNIDSNNWVDLFIPRSFFGKYIFNKVSKELEKAEKKELIQLTLTTAKAIDLIKINNFYKIELESGRNILSEKVILSLGSLPTKNIYAEETVVKKDQLLLINDIYSKDLDLNFQEIESFIKNRKSKETNVLVIGANASGLETFYKLNNSDIIKNIVSNFTILSTQGIIPDSTADLKLQKEYEPKNLVKLQSKKDLTAKQIADAVFLDLDYAEENKIGAATTVDIISNAFGELLSKLSPDEKEIFACEYGNKIGRRQRCAGTHYTDVIFESSKNEKLDVLAGRFQDLIIQKDNAFKFTYLDTKTSKVAISEKAIHLIINCTGSINLDHENAPTLIKKLINKKYCVPNSSKIGFKVNRDFETQKSLYIAGPLLAGNVIEENPVWHLEHCGRIIWTSKKIGKLLI